MTQAVILKLASIESLELMTSWNPAAAGEKFDCEVCGVKVQDNPAPVLHGYRCYDCWAAKLLEFDTVDPQHTMALQDLAVIAAMCIAGAIIIIAGLVAVNAVEQIGREPGVIQSIQELDAARAAGAMCYRQASVWRCV